MDTPGHGSTSVDASNGQITYTPDSNWNGHDHFTYKVCDNGLPLPALCDDARVDIAVGSVNDRPVSDAGTDQTVNTLVTVTLNGSASFDPDGHLPLAYQWSQVGGSHVTLSSTSVVSPTFGAPDDPTVLTFTLRVIDAQGQADLVPDAVVVTVTNRPPIVDAGADQKVLLGTTVTLDGSNSVDPDNDLPLTYTWTQTSGPSVELDDPSATSPTFVAPDKPAELTFSLFISDALGEPALHADEVVVTVREPYMIYMPLMTSRYAIAPDLVIQSVTATSNNVQVVIKNVGDAAVTDEFWVDAYVNPRVAPSHVNQAWWELGDEGLAWWISGPALAALVPGGSTTLRIHDAYYVEGESNIDTWPLPVGTTLYAQADSYDPGTTHGMVLESHEVAGQAYNNIFGPVSSTAAASAATMPPTEYGDPVSPGTVPPRR
jgi:hypothetical protein